MSKKFGLLFLVILIGLVSFCLIRWTPGVLAQVVPPATVTAAHFSVAPLATTANGFNDNLPRQIIRTNADQLYLFGGVVGTGKVNIFWNPAGGYPNSSADFSGSASFTNPSAVFIVDGAYDGGNFIHILVSDMSGTLRDYPFNTSTKTFSSPIVISTGNSKPVSNADIGTTGVSSMFDSSGMLHVAYWSASNQIMYKSFTYNSGANTLTQTSGPTRLDSSGTATHPELVVSPFDQSVTVAWVNGLSGSGTISARSKAAGGGWGVIEAASSGAVWTSTNSGYNIDQGPSMVVTSDGTKAFTYIADFGSCATDYGRLHFVSKLQGASSWTDQTLNNFCTHANGLGIDSNNNFFAISHGHPTNPTCTSMTQVCVVSRNSNGTWNNPVVFANPPLGDSMDNSVSTKWSAVGWNRPETVEFAFFDAIGGSYQNTGLWYGRLDTSGIIPSPSPTPTPSPSPSPTPSPSPAANSALSFNGTNSRATGVSFAGEEGSQTMEAWIKPLSNNANGTVFFTRNDADNQGWLIELANGQVTLWVADGVNDHFIKNTNITLLANTWYHVAASYDSSTHQAAVYINGNKGASADLGPISTCGNCLPLRMGGYSSFPFFGGQVDELRISSGLRYTESFSPPTGSFTPDVSTLALYHFDEGSGQQAVDSSGHNYTLTLGLNSATESVDPVWVSSSAGGPLPTPTPTPSPTPTSSPTLTPSPTPTPTPTPSPTSTPNPDSTPPSKPTNLIASAPTYNKVNLSWTDSTDDTGVTGYYVIRDGVTIGQTITTTYSDTTVNAQTQYNYTVMAFDAAANISATSDSATVTTPVVPDTTPPTAPTNLTGTAVSQTQINISWTASNDNVGVSSYLVFRNSAQIATLSSSTLSFGDTGLNQGVTYQYIVRATDAAGNTSADSATANISTFPTPTPTPTPSPTPTPTPVPTATPTPSPTTITKQVSTSSDDVNQDGTTLSITDPTNWTGTGASTTSSYLGLRFTGVSIPKGATITSAKLQVYSTQSSWITNNFSIAADAVGNSPTFATANKPSQRTLTTAKVSHADNVQWNANTWYILDESAPILQEIVNRPDWQQGNALSLILKGTGSAYARKNIRSFDNSAVNAPKLVVTYR